MGTAVVSTDKAVLVGTVFDVVANDSQGEALHHFLKPIIITLVVPDDLRDRTDLHAYYLSQGSHDWQRISDALFDNTSVTFAVDHLTRFAIFATNDAPETIPASNTPIQYELFWAFIILAVMLALAWVSFKRTSTLPRFPD